MTKNEEKELEDTINLAYKEIDDEMEELEKTVKLKKIEEKKKKEEKENNSKKDNSTNNDKWYKKAFNIINKFKILNIVLFILSFILLFITNKLGIVPDKIFIIGLVIILLLDCIPLILNFFKNKKVLIVGYITTLVLIIINGIGIYYVNVTDNFFTKHFGNNKVVYTTKFDVVATVSSNSTIESIDGKKLGYYSDTSNIDKAFEKLDKNTENIAYDDIVKMFKELDTNINLVLIEDELYELLFSSETSLKKENYTIIYTYEIEVEEDTTKKEVKIIEENPEEEGEKIVVNPNNINIYIGGTDFTGKLYDFNMIVTINPDQKKVLMTSIPRDYHIAVAGKNGRKDNINYIGAWGINTTMESIQNLLNINLHYYLKVNTNSLVGIVDKLGGITYCSDYQYYTTHDVILDSYDDTGKNKLYVEKGCKRYNGVQTLTIARERKAFSGGDRQRQKNCQDILMAIFKEMVSVNSIMNYESILNSLGNLYTTSIPRDVITRYAKDIISNSSSWQIEKQSLDGGDSNGYVHLTSLRDYVMEPYPTSVKNASRKIRSF